MKQVQFLLKLAIVLGLLPVLTLAADTPSDQFYTLRATSLNGKVFQFDKLRGKVVLVSNIALRCGTTPQLGALQKLYETYSKEGLVVLGFPSNDFTGEDLSSTKAIKDTCSDRFGVSFPIFKPGSIKGDRTQPVFAFLTESGGDEIKGPVNFNFEKFLIDRSGILRNRFGSFTGAQSEVVENAVRTLLKEGEDK